MCLQGISEPSDTLKYDLATRGQLVGDVEMDGKDSNDDDHQNV